MSYVLNLNNKSYNISYVSYNVFYVLNCSLFKNIFTNQDMSLEPKLKQLPMTVALNCLITLIK